MFLYVYLNLTFIIRMIFFPNDIFYEKKNLRNKLFIIVMLFLFFINLLECIKLLYEYRINKKLDFCKELGRLFFI